MTDDELPDAHRPGPAMRAALRRLHPLPRQAGEVARHVAEAARTRRPVRLGAVGIDVRHRLPSGLSLMHVQRERSGDLTSYRVRAWCWCGAHPPLDLPPHPERLIAPDLTLARLHSEGEDPSELLLAVAEWSARHERLTDWLARLADAHGPGHGLVIRDDTGSELPWELLWLPGRPARPTAQRTEHAEHAGSPPPRLLGATLRTTRWIVRDPRERLPEPAPPRPGRVLSYTEAGMSGDTEAFRPFAHTSHTRFPVFLDQLEDVAEETGLVYVACHGTFGERLGELRLGNTTWRELNTRPMRALAGQHPVVYLNACHSGRSVDNSAQGEARLRGFTELFLRKGAAGCVVAMGAVNDAEARETVHAVMAMLAAAPRISLAEALRRHRAEVTAAFPDLRRLPTLYDGDAFDVPGQRRVRRLLYTYMFHHYGHPHGLLGLREQEAGASAPGEEAGGA
ncbi:CHAT domain-containing protein [Streptomyces sp. Tu6071]|uniref:CHAT domain-containing protein n=1 Tax=Streptomyces sp. Tu6071 TaxID=355249 RepID=UPI000312728D|nr:CHAT domain-containing protein [Streptomyces sp. Tu6071]